MDAGPRCRLRKVSVSPVSVPAIISESTKSTGATINLNQTQYSIVPESGSKTYIYANTPFDLSGVAGDFYTLQVTATTAGGVIPSITDPSAPSTATTQPSGPPPPPVATTTTTNGAGQIDCGTRYLASGWPTTTVPYPGFADCIQQAFASGTSAIYVERAQTDGEGGHIEITTYEVVGARLVRRTVDSTGAQPPGGVVVSTCTGLTHDSQVVVASGCHA